VLVGRFFKRADTFRDLGEVVPAGVLAADRGELLLEALEIREVAIDRREPHVGDLVERLELGQHALADIARLDLRQAELADLKGRIEYEIRSALLELKAVTELLKAAESRVALADAQLRQATDRFAAGVASNLEVVEAQEAVATASESRIGTLYIYNSAKAALARAMGLAEEQAARLLKDERK